MADPPPPLPDWPAGFPVVAGEEPVFCGGVSLSLPIDMLEELPSLSPILSLHSWALLDESERASLRPLLPAGTRECPGGELDALLRGDPRPFFFGSPLARAWDGARAGRWHPRVVRYEAAYDALSRAAHAHLVRGHHDAQRAALLECAAAFDCARDGAGGGGGGDADAEPTRDKLRRLDAARAERRGGGGAKRARAEAAEVAAEG